MRMAVSTDYNVYERIVIIERRKLDQICRTRQVKMDSKNVICVQRLCRKMRDYTVNNFLFNSNVIHFLFVGIFVWTYKVTTKSSILDYG